MGNQNQPNSPTKTAKQPQNKANPNKINEIPDIASNNFIISQEEAERRQLGVSQIANKFVAIQESKKAEQKKVDIDPSRLLVTNLKGDKRYSLQAEVVTVPFDVVLATMDPQLLETFNILGDELKSYYVKEDKYEQQWKLHGNGFYINYELGHEVVIITNHLIYKGVVVTNKQRKIVPDEFGMLINKLGKYTGHFKNGKANGQGAYIEKKSMSEFKGEWVEGYLVKGIIVNNEFQFEGKFDKKANGQGAIRFKQTGASYIGNFVDGQYDTLHRETAIYKTQAYQYSGHFKAGKKQGEGVLTQFPKNIKPNKNGSTKDKILNKKIKFRPTDRYDGLWQDDYFITTRQQRQKKKIRDIFLNADIVNKITQGQQNPFGKKQKIQIVQQQKIETKKPLSSTKSDEMMMFEVAEQQHIQSQI